MVESRPVRIFFQIDLAQIDFDKLRERFNQGKKRTEVERLKGAVQKKLTEMVRLNKTRVDFLEEFRRLIDEYNTDSKNVEIMFAQLLAFTQKLSQEDQRHIAEALSEEELAVFDLLRRPEVTLTPKEEKEVKRIVHELLETLKREKLVLDWRKRQQTRAAVKVHIEEVLDKLPEAYTPELWQETVETIYQHVYDSYQGQGKSIYA